MTASLLKVRNLSVVYPAEGVIRNAVTNVSLDVPVGKIVGIVGENGCGKSTLALAILGLTKPGGTISEGTVEFEGQELLKLSYERWRLFRGKKIGYVTQNPRGALNPIKRVGDQVVSYYLAHSDATEHAARARALELFEMMGINDPLHRLRAFPHELSGGMAQRVLIAMALSCRPRLVIADEPTSGLDVTIQAQVLDDMKRTAEQVGSSVLLITHDLGVVANYCDRVCLMHAGEVVEEAPVNKFFAEPSQPAAIALLAAQGAGLDHAKVRMRGLPVDTRRLPSGCWLHRRCPFAEEQAGCASVHPELVEISPDHLVRCHRAAEMRLLAERSGDPTDYSEVGLSA